jgi:hypothetical protein
MGLRDRNKVMLRKTEHHFILVTDTEHRVSILGLRDQNKVMLRKTEHHFILAAVHTHMYTYHLLLICL